MLEMIKTEIEAIFWVMVGLVFLGVSLLMSDIFTGLVDRIFKKN